MKKWVSRILLFTMLGALLAVLFWPRLGTTCGATISDKTRDRILTVYFQELDKGQVIRPISCVEIFKSGYSDQHYKPAVKFFGPGKIRVEGEDGISVFYQVHLENENSPRLGQVFIEEKRYQNGKLIATENETTPQS